MSIDETNDVGRLIAAHRAGDTAAWSSLIKLVYAELRRLAHIQSAGRPRDRTLNTTSLVNECYLRLLAPAQRGIQDQHHFFALASRIMRQVMCDYAKERLADKREGGRMRQPVEALELESLEEAGQLLELDDVLRKLAESNPRGADVFECRYFGGLSEQQTADALGISLRTVQREWNAARAWMQDKLS